MGADLKFTGVANQRRGRADVYSKVLRYMTYTIVSLNLLRRADVFECPYADLVDTISLHQMAS